MNKIYLGLALMTPFLFFLFFIMFALLFMPSNKKKREEREDGYPFAEVLLAASCVAAVWGFIIIYVS